VLNRNNVSDSVKKKNVNMLAEEIPLKILIAEDNITNQKLAKLVLTKMGYSPDIASDGFEVLEAVDQKQYDLIFMDVQMPRMDGIEATKKIVSMNNGIFPKI